MMVGKLGNRVARAMLTLYAREDQPMAEDERLNARRPSEALDDLYLLWSTEHGGVWWGAPSGYTGRISKARRFTREQALEIAIRAIVGTAARLGAIPELPVRLTDVQAMQSLFRTRFPIAPPAFWE